MIKDIINNLEENQLRVVKNHLKNYISFYSIDSIDAASKEMVIEKVYDYIETCKIENKIKDNCVYKFCVNTLYSYLKISSSKDNKRISRYLEKLKTIKRYFDKNPDEENINLLKDFIRVYLALYTTQIKKPKGYKDEDFSFFVKDINAEEVIKNLKKEKRGNDKYEKISLSIVLLTIIYESILNEKIEEQ